MIYRNDIASFIYACQFGKTVTKKLLENIADMDLDDI